MTSDMRSSFWIGPITARRHASPAAWPRVSLISLKWSRSMKRSAIGSPLACARAQAAFSRSISERRFSTPVSGSVCARRSASESATRCSRRRSATPSATSIAAATIDSGRPYRRSGSAASTIDFSAVQIVMTSSSVHATRNQPAGRLPRIQARNAMTSVYTAVPRKTRLPTAVMTPAVSGPRRRFETASTTNATDSQPKAT